MYVETAADGLTVHVETEDDTDALGGLIAGAVGPNAVLGLVGPLGAGKTRLVRAVAVALGVDPLAVSSPTFVLIHEYEGRLPVFHFDAYRLNGPGPFEALGVSDYWEAGGVCLVEWADLVAGVLPASAWWVAIEPTGATSRRVRVSGPGVSALADVFGNRGRSV